MIITEVKKSDAGDYSCSAVNKFGTAKSDAKVTVVCKLQLGIYLETVFFFSKSMILEPEAGKYRYFLYF